MNKIFGVFWADVAENDLNGLVQHISEDDPVVAIEVLNKIRDRVDSLYEFPDKGRIVPELLEQGIAEYYELIIPPWRLMYKIVDKTVFVLSVIDSRRNVEDILLRRMIDR